LLIFRDTKEFPSPSQTKKRKSISKSLSASSTTNDSPNKKKIDVELSKSDAKNAGRLIQDEKMEIGSIPWKTYQLYIKSAGGYIISFLVLLTFIINIGSTGNYCYSYCIKEIINDNIFLFP